MLNLHEDDCWFWRHWRCTLCWKLCNPCRHVQTSLQASMNCLWADTCRIVCYKSALPNLYRDLLATIQLCPNDWLLRLTSLNPVASLSTATTWAAQARLFLSSVLVVDWSMSTKLRSPSSTQLERPSTNLQCIYQDAQQRHRGPAICPQYWYEQESLTGLQSGPGLFGSIG